jgi:peptide/nickel transport system permease protein
MFRKELTAVDGLLNLVLKRILLGLLTLFLVTLVVFFAVELRPGDYAEAFLMRWALPDTVAKYREILGLDQPAILRFFQWLGRAMSGDLGRSYANGTPVFEMIWPRFKDTAFLAFYAATLAFPLSVVLGLITVLFRNTLFDRSLSAVALLAVSLPEFFMAYVLIALLSVGLWNGSEMILGGWFPPIAIINDDLSFIGRLYVTTLPAITLTLVILAHTMRMTRATVISVLASPYIEMAHLKGLRRSRIIWKHAFPNALAPIFNVVAVNLAYLITGVVIIEVVFVYPGLATLLVDSVSMRNIPVVQGSCLLFAVVYVVLNLVADLASMLTNPVLRFPKIL